MSKYPCTFINDGKGGKMPFLPFVTQQHIDILSNEFVTHNNDIYVVTYPRSGTTWTEQIVHLIINKGNQGEQRLTDAAPWLEPLAKRPHGMKAFLKTLNSPRLFTSHLPISLMPDFSSDKGRYIYVARNPKDVAVSYYFHDRSKSGYEGSWHEYFNLFIQGKVMYGLWFDHVLPWWQASQKANNILFIKYEDMKRDLAKIIAQIAKFIDVPMNQTLLEQVMAGSNFKAMATGKQTNFNWIPQQEGIPKHYRKGIIGDWRNQFTTEQTRIFDEIYTQKMSGVGLQFDFGDDFIA